VGTGSVYLAAQYPLFVTAHVTSAIREFVFVDQKRVITGPAFVMYRLLPGCAQPLIGIAKANT